MAVDATAGGAGWVDEFVLALAARGATDRWAGQQQAWVRELLAFAGGSVWEVRSADVDGWLARARDRGAGTQTRREMAQAVHRFYAFVEARHGRLVQEVTGRSVPRPVDEFNRPRRLAQVGVRIPPSAREMETLFQAWRASLPCTAGRGFLAADRDYVAALGHVPCSGVTVPG